MRPLLATSPPLVSKKAVGELFGPVADIAAFSHALLESLVPFTSAAEPKLTADEPLSTIKSLSLTPPPPSPTSSSSASVSPPRIALALLRLMPFLSLYHPFITNFPRASSLLAAGRKDPAQRPFARWLAEREKADAARKLRLGDWLLTVVQRVPRYLLLVKVRPPPLSQTAFSECCLGSQGRADDCTRPPASHYAKQDLVACTPKDDPEYAGLQGVLTLVENGPPRFLQSGAARVATNELPLCAS